MVNKYSILIIEFFLFPILVICNSVCNWFFLIIDLLKNIRINHKIQGFGIINNLNNYHYKSIYYYLKTYGYDKKINLDNEINYSTNNFWHFSKINGLIFEKFGIWTLLVSYLFLNFSVYFFFSEKNIVNYLIFLIFFFSQTNFILLLIRQNYNIIAWSLVPMFVYFYQNEFLIYYILSTLFIAYISVTASFFLFLYLLFEFFINFKTINIIGIFIFVLITSFRLLILSNSKNLINIIYQTIINIGFSNNNVKYLQKMNIRGITNNFIFIYYLFFILLFYLLSNVFNNLVLLSFLLLFFNLYIKRIADIESVISILNISLIIYLFQIEISYIYLLFIIILFNLPARAFEKKFSFLYKYEKLINNIKIENFLMNLLNNFKNKKILISFNNPKNQWSNLFDGQGFLLEIFNFVSIKLNIKLLPNYFYVYQINKLNNKDFWGRDSKSINNNIINTNSDYFIYYENDEQINELCKKNNYKIIEKINWKNYFGKKLMVHNWFILKNLNN